MDSTMHAAMGPTGDECGQPRNQPCTRACTQSATENGTAANVQSGKELPAKNGRCPRGFSALQIAILSVLKTHRQIIAYWQIAELVTASSGVAATTGAVRGALERMYRRGFILRNREAIGSLKGNRYAFAADPCPYIVVYSATESGGQAGKQSSVQSGQIVAPSILEEIDRKNTLSISSEEGERIRLEALGEADMAFYWPKLTGNGFGTYQMRQIIQRLEQRGLPFSNVLQGLTHAEWELEHGLMRDKEGKPVALPTNWVFQILAKQGYYPRPVGYVSPQEQAERDAAEEQKRFAAAQEERLKTECDAWIAGLSEDERSAIQGVQNGPVRIPGDVLLRNHFRAEVWGKLQNEGAK